MVGFCEEQPNFAFPTNMKDRRGHTASVDMHAIECLMATGLCSDGEHIEKGDVVIQLSWNQGVVRLFYPGDKPPPEGVKRVCKWVLQDL